MVSLRARPFPPLGGELEGQGPSGESEGRKPFRGILRGGIGLDSSISSTLPYINRSHSDGGGVDILDTIMVRCGGGRSDTWNLGGEPRMRT